MGSYAYVCLLVRGSVVEVHVCGCDQNCVHAVRSLPYPSHHFEEPAVYVCVSCISVRVCVYMGVWVWVGRGPGRGVIAKLSSCDC